jgi:hypothetical protein
MRNLLELVIAVALVIGGLWLFIEHWLLTIIGIHFLGFWILLFWVVRLRRQVRCLHFCFFGISDWGITNLKEITEYYNENFGPESRPFFDIEEEWKKETKYYFGLIKSARVRVPPDNHIDYEDIPWWWWFAAMIGW